MSGPVIIREYACCVPKWCSHYFKNVSCGGCMCDALAGFDGEQERTRVRATSGGKARARFLGDLWDSYCRSDVGFPDVKVQSMGPVNGHVTSGMLSIMRCYDLPPIHCGMALSVHGEAGVLVEADSAYLHVLFIEGRDAGYIMPCHPLDHVEYASEKAVR